MCVWFFTMILSCHPLVPVSNVRLFYHRRCFSFGIGEGASTSLIKGIARASGGAAEFITGNERMQSKVRGRPVSRGVIQREWGGRGHPAARAEATYCL